MEAKSLMMYDKGLHLVKSTIPWQQSLEDEHLPKGHRIQISSSTKIIKFIKAKGGTYSLKTPDDVGQSGKSL